MVRKSSACAQIGIASKGGSLIAFAISSEPLRSTDDAEEPRGWAAASAADAPVGLAFAFALAMPKGERASLLESNS
eukprot:6173302-Alexandrium_andersonii.AAC.1